MAKKVIKDLLKKEMAKKSTSPSVKVDSTKKVTIGGNAKPSAIIKKQTTVKPAKPIMSKMPMKKAIIKKMMK